MRPKAHFDAAVERAEHVLRLYELIQDTRERGVRADWASGFKNLMHWPKGETIVRVDGKDQLSMLILREGAGVDRDRFAHDYLSELLRSAVVAVVSALDRYVHDLVVYHSWRLLSGPEEDVPKGLRELSIPLSEVKRALKKQRKAATSRPGVIVKEALRKVLHRDHTFQGPDELVTASKMLGLKDFWDKVARAMPGNPAKQGVLEKLRLIARRRNQIVHEADIVLKAKAHSVVMRNITHETASDWLCWMKALVAAIDQVVEASV